MSPAGRTFGSLISSAAEVRMADSVAGLPLNQPSGDSFAARPAGWEPPTSGAGDDALGDAIQTACAALLALHTCTRTVANLPGEHDEVEQELNIAVELVHAAIDQLQMLPPAYSGFSPGFVGRERPTSWGDQSSPWRTA
jgi:hypothetical protein